MALARRALLGAASAALAAPALRAQEVVVKMGALRLIHSIAPYLYERFQPAGMRIEVIPFESPTEGKNAVVTKSVDFGAFGIAAGILGAAAREPVVVVGSCCDRGMAVVAKKDAGIQKLADLRGKRVGIWPGSTQEVFILERLRMEGMTIRDVQSVRVSFSEMPIALARGDVDAYVGAEPGPGVSLAAGIGKIVEYPYSTPMGSLNMIFATHPDTVAQRPDLVRSMLKVHRQASEFGMANRDATIETAVAKLGMRRDALEMSLPNVELNWQMTPEMVTRARTYAEQMLSLKQIRALPDFATFFEPKFSDELAKSAA
ncbi:NrtA/SsuA/CpmA family ABC transporter substrate-binding protein [Belnapia sp. T6]|uniref:NrtA/SsuA/CpmA family ABC transporter substrate-binding protein n=1 Tax=Belnapia mucosa TaxID=2804532 RepID=A0ABS1UZ81_9PROT|nr:NrtA/SsuA/CpmA family ABC transporter substrate-binding protein [Belnapia mucosa]MBL6454312.1 NrtA/SsuA/CpmA family ABC transporter substrate-binding protein [Belnapia mucosa]